MAIRVLCGAAAAALLVTAPAGATRKWRFHEFAARAALTVGIFIGATALAFGVLAPRAQADTIYNSLYNPLPPNVPSIPYQAQKNSEVGNAIQFAGTARSLTNAVLTLSDWAQYGTYTSDPNYNSSGWQWPLTLTLYNVGPGNTLGSAIASQTIDPTILWRPVPDNCGGDPTAYTGSDGSCNHGIAQNVTFNFSSVTVPNQIVYGLSFNTQTYGPNPTGVNGPYNSLNFALNYVYLSNTPPYIGSDLSPATYLWRDTGSGFSASSYNSYYYVPAIQFNAVPEPSSLMILGASLFGFFGLAGFGRGRRKASALDLGSRSRPRSAGARSLDPDGRAVGGDLVV